MYRISVSNNIRHRFQLILPSLFLLISVTGTFSAPEVDSIHVELYLSYNRTRSLVARGDTLWAGTDKGGVARYVASDTSLLQFITSDGLAGNEIRRIIPAEVFDAVWAATNNGFSYVSEREIRSYTTANSVPLKRISDIAAIGDRVAVASEPGLSVFKNGQLEKLFPLEAMFSGRVAYGKDSTLWAADMYGIYKVENKILKKIDTPSDISLNLIYTMAVDSDNRLWIAGDPGPDLDFTAHYDGTEWFICTEENSGLKHSVGRLRFDTAGNLIGASNEGVSRFRNGH